MILFAMTATEEGNQEKEKEKEKKEITLHTLKRPGLFAVKAILENAKGGWGRFSDLAATTEGVRNRRDYLAYIRLLTRLGWLETRGIDMPSTDLKRGPKASLYYDVTAKGQAFLDSFPKKEEREGQSDTKSSNVM